MTRPVDHGVDPGDLDLGAVLIVDDDPAMGETIVDILSLGRVPAESVTTGLAAMARQPELHPAVAVVDYRLPDMAGVDLCASLKETDPDLSIILLTGYASLESAIAAVPHIDEYLTKPVHPDDLARAVTVGRERCLLRRDRRALVARVQRANTDLATSVNLRSNELAGLIAMVDAGASAPDLAALAGSLAVAAGVASRADGTALYLDDGAQGGVALLAGTSGVADVPRRLYRHRPTTLDDAVTLPLEAAGEWVGYLVLRSPRANDMYLQALASQTAVAIQNMVRLERERETVERISELSRLKSSFLAGVSHELRTPLSAMYGFSQLLATDGEALGPEQRSDLTWRIVRQAERLWKLIEDLLDASRMEFGGFRVTPGTVWLPEVMARVLEDFPQGTAQLSVSIPDGLPAVWADDARLVQVLSNLVHNAQKYSPPGERIDIGARWDGASVITAVADRGPGIDPAFLPRLFDPFSQEDSEHTSRDGGLGLGLYISRGLVEAMGGTLSVEGRDGGGTTFAVHLQPAESPNP